VLPTLPFTKIQQIKIFKNQSMLPKHPNFESAIHGKIVLTEQLDKLTFLWRFRNNKIIFTNGCFDLLHDGHLELLMKAKDLGGKLIVGINSDASVKRLKGEKRPIKSEKSRLLQLAALQMVDAVVLFEEDTPIELIKLIQPDILVKGGDYDVATIVGAKEVQANGGSVVVIPLVEGFSTTRIISLIQ